MDIDLVAICEDQRRIRFGTCKRNPDEPPGVAHDLKKAMERFLEVHGHHRIWRTEWVGTAPGIPDAVRDARRIAGIQAQRLTDLIDGLQ